MRWEISFKTADSLILKEFLSVFAFTFGLFAAIAFTLVLFTDMDEMQNGNASFGLCMSYVLLRFPHEIVKAIPMVVVISTVTAVGNMVRHNEMLMLFIAGYSPLRLAAPLAILLTVMIAAFFVANEKICGPFAAKAHNLMEIQIKGANAGSTGTSDLWMHGRSGQMFHVEEYFPYSEEMQGLSIFYFDGPNHKLSARMKAEKASWDAERGAWRVNQVIAHEYKQDGTFRRYIKDQDYFSINRTPEDFGRVIQDPEQMSLSDLKHLVDAIRDAGQNPRAYLPDLRIKQAFPFAIFFLGILGYAMSLRLGSVGKTSGIGLSLLAVIAYYMSLSVGKNLAKVGAIPSWLCAWLPNFICLLLTLWLFDRLRKDI